MSVYHGSSRTAKRLRVGRKRSAILTEVTLLDGVFVISGQQIPYRDVRHDDAVE